jgi:integrase
MKLALTDKFCERAKPGEWFDEKATGLALRVGKNRKTWCLHTTKDGVRGRETIGHYPAMSLAAARRVALEGPSEATMFKIVAEDWLTREAGMVRNGDKVTFNGTLRRPEERLSVFERLVYPALGDRPIEQIKRSEITAMLDDIADENGPVMADRTLAYVRRVMNWHATRVDDFRPPIVAGMARTKASELERDRILTDAEIKAVWNAEPASAGLTVFHRYLKFLLLTALRRNEASEGHHKELNGVWIIPAARMKSKLDFVVPLTKPALALIGGHKGYWFSTDGGATPISGFSKFKAAFDKACGVKDWTLHDLRRSARSLMSRAGVVPDIAERCLAHKIGGVRGVYDRYAYLEEKREALERLAQLVRGIVNA